MKKPSHYTLLRAAIENGSLETIRDIQRFVPITVLTKDMMLNYNTLSKRLLAWPSLPWGMSHRLSILMGMDPSELYKKLSREVKVRK